jgi:effector-binding domain-containing protein
MHKTAWFAAAAVLAVLPSVSPARDQEKGVSTEPRVERRAEKHYLGIRAVVSVRGMATVVPKLYPELGGWLKSKGVKPAGPPFTRYHVIDMPERLEVEVCFPVQGPVKGDARVRPGVLPAGRYAVLVHTGHFSELVGANAALQAWAKKKSIRWQYRETEKGSVWAGRAEFELRGPVEEKDPAKWQTEVAYLMAAGSGK